MPTKRIIFNELHERGFNANTPETRANQPAGSFLSGTDRGCETSGFVPWPPRPEGKDPVVSGYCTRSIPKTAYSER